MHARLANLVIGLLALLCAPWGVYRGGGPVIAFLALAGAFLTSCAAFAPDSWEDARVGWERGGRGFLRKLFPPGARF